MAKSYERSTYDSGWLGHEQGGISLDVDFSVHYWPYDPGDRLTPPQGPEIEITGVTVEAVELYGGLVVKRSDASPGWFEWLDKWVAERSENSESMHERIMARLEVYR